MPLYSTLLLSVCVGTALTSYTISTANRLTTQATTTENIKVYFTKQEGNWTFDLTTGQFHCDSEERAVSNCDLLVLLGDIESIINKNNHQILRYYLRGIEPHVQEVLGQLQEVRGGLHNRPQRSTKAATALEAVQNATSQILVELDTLRGRQALAATIQVFQLLLFLAYLVVQGVVCAVKKCKKHRARQVE